MIKRHAFINESMGSLLPAGVPLLKKSNAYASIHLLPMMFVPGPKINQGC